MTQLLACGPYDNDGDNFDESSNDCDDSNPDIHPYALEICDGIDNNCDGLIDDSRASGARTWYADLDRDGYGDDGLTTVACEQPEGYAPNKWDCNESNEFVNPGAEELCDGIDNDCDGEVDEITATDAYTWYPDYDGDGFGNPDLGKNACVPPADYISEAGDCNDNDPLVNPTQIESCLTNVDDNCDGEINGEDSADCIHYFGDLDGDGFPGTSACLCEPNEVYFYEASDDCDDNNPDLSPASEQEDEGFSDLNCDGEVILRMGEADLSYETNQSGSQGDWRNQRRPIDIEYGDVDGDGLSDFALSTKRVNGDDTPYVFLQTGSQHSIRHELNTDTDVTITGIETSLFSDEGLKKDIGVMPIEIMDVNLDGLDDLIVVQVTESDQWEIATFFAPLDPSYTLNEADHIGTLDIGPVTSTWTYRVSLNSLQTDDSPAAELLIGNPNRTSTSGYTDAGGFKILEFDNQTQMWETTQDVTGFEQNHFFGEQAESAGDTNGDGITDFVLLSSSIHTLDPFGQATSTRGGSVSLYTDRSAYPSSTIVSNIFYRRIANQFAGQGDYNGDGYDDLAFSAEDSYLHQQQAGRTHIVWGPLDSGVTDIIDIRRTILVGFQPEMDADCPVSVGDVNGDGADDLLIGAHGYKPDPDQPAKGSAFLWFGEEFEGIRPVNDGTVRIDNDPTGVRIAGSCRPDDNRRFQGGIGDVNGDGFDDFLIRGDDSMIDPDFYDNMWLFYGRTR